MAARIMLAGAIALAATAATAAGEPQWLQEARAREATLPEPAAIASKDGRFRARVPARPRGEITEEQGSYSIELDIGTGAEPVWCEIYPEGLDLANGLAATSATSFELIAKAQGRLEAREIERTGAGWNGAAAFLQAEWIYVVNVEKEKRLGALKQIVFERNGVGVYCAHNEIGYRQTFERAAHELARTLEWETEAPAGRYSEVFAVKLGEHTSGVAQIRVQRDEDGDDRVTSSLSMLVPVAAGEVRAHDEFNVEFVDADGELINAVQVSNQNGELDSNLRLDPHEDGGWLVSGDFKGKRIETRIPGDRAPSSSLRQFALVQALLQEPEPAGRSVHYLRWSDDSPTAFVEGTVTAVAPLGAGLWSTRFASEGLVFEAVADMRDGTMTRASIPMGPLQLQLERVAVSGQL